MRGLWRGALRGRAPTPAPPVTTNLRCRNPLRSRCTRLLPLLLLPLAACSAWLFSGEDRVDRSRPVALIETTGGVEYGATTEFGILTLGRSATEGPCRVHYFLGPTPLMEEGAIVPTGSVFWRANMDLRTQHLRALDHSPTAEEPLVAMWTVNGLEATRVEVHLANDPGVHGDVLADPGPPLPPGAAIFAQGDDELLFVGLVSGLATLEGKGLTRRYYTFQGVDRVREMLAIPEVHPTDSVRFRPDDITVRERAR